MRLLLVYFMTTRSVRAVAWTLLAVGGGCVRKGPEPSAAPPSEVERCRSSFECTEYGLCSPTEGVCAALSDADCARGRACERYGACAARVGRCVGAPRPSCRASGSERIDWCIRGDCEFTPTNGVCAAPLRDDAACRRSAPGTTGDPCTLDGLCHVRDGFCAATDDAECRASEACKRDGHCVARAGLCVAESADACRNSRACREEGRCSRGTSRCHATDADCATTAACRDDPAACKAEGGACKAAKFIYFQF